MKPHAVGSNADGGWLNSRWHSCCRHVIRRCRQTLFFCVVMTCGLILFVGHSAINYAPPADRDAIVTAPTDPEPKSTAAAAVVERQLGYFEKVGHHNIFVQGVNNVVNMESNAVGRTPLRVGTPVPSNGDSPSVQMNTDDPSAFRRWKTTRRAACGGRLEFFGNKFARLSRAIVDLDHCNAGARGGENVDSVLNQAEQAEYYNNIVGCFQLSDCDASSVLMQRTYRFMGSTYLNDWLRNMKLNNVDVSTPALVDTTFTIAITRHEYANLYHTLTDWYNAYLVMRFFGKLPNETNILFVDAHPRGHLDDAWRRLFNRTYFMSELPKRTVFTELVWGIQGYDSLIKDNFGPDPPPYMEDFRSFFLSSWGVTGLDRALDCSAPKVLFLWRRDYVAHPRNPSGVIQRKIQNEDEILRHVRRAHPEYVVNGVQLDSYGIGEQLQLIADTDVLIGMHGAGLAYVVFVPVHGALVELFPSYYTGANRHMGDLARWRGMGFVDWHSYDHSSELAGYRTRVPAQTVDMLLQSAVGKMCRRSTPPKPNVQNFPDVRWKFHAQSVNV